MRWGIPSIKGIADKVKAILPKNNKQPDNTERNQAIICERIASLRKETIDELNYIKGSLQDVNQISQTALDDIRAKLEDSSGHTVYVQSLATLSKAVNAILEKQEKHEQHMISLVTALNKLTQG